MNKAIIVGRLGKDPELKYTPTGLAVATFSVATGYKDNTQWHRVVAWRKTAELCAEHLKKGSLVAIDGRIETRNWDDDGKKRYVTEIVVEVIRFLSSKNEEKDDPTPLNDADDNPF